MGLETERSQQQATSAFPAPFQESTAQPQVLEYQSERHALFSSEAGGRTHRSTRYRSPSSLEGKERRTRRRLTHSRREVLEGNAMPKVKWQLQNCWKSHAGGPRLNYQRGQKKREANREPRFKSKFMVCAYPLRHSVSVTTARVPVARVNQQLQFAISFQIRAH